MGDPIGVDSGVCDEIVVSTEDEQIRLAAFLAGAKVHERPRRLAQDDTLSIEVVRDAVAAFPGFDVVMLLQPTSPLRTGDDIRGALKLMGNSEAVVSVTETRHPEVYTINPLQRLRPVAPDVSARKIVVPNGAIFAITTEALAEGLDWWTCTTCYGFEMPAARSVDIDTAADLELARTIMERREVAA
jgi:CMP-N,N'-diacetyllegionaminic acid synthase